MEFILSILFWLFIGIPVGLFLVQIVLGWVLFLAMLVASFFVQQQ